MTDPLTIKLKEASARTGLSKRTISKLIKKGYVRGTKPEKEVLVYWESLKQHLTRHTMQSA